MTEKQKNKCGCTCKCCKNQEKEACRYKLGGEGARVSKKKLKVTASVYVDHVHINEDGTKSNMEENHSDGQPVQNVGVVDVAEDEQQAHMTCDLNLKSDVGDSVVTEHVEANIERTCDVSDQRQREGPADWISCTIFPKAGML